MLEYLEHQKKLTANQWKIIATANVGDMLDFFDFFLISYVLAFILREWQLTYGQPALIPISAGPGWATGSAGARCSSSMRSMSLSPPA